MRHDPTASPESRRELPCSAVQLAEQYADGEWDFRSVQLPGADLRGFTLSQSDLRGANLAGADLAGATLIGADLTGADLSGASLRGADLTGANLLGALLLGADLRGAELRRARLERETLRGAELGGVILLCSGGRVDKQLDIRQAIAAGLFAIPGIGDKRPSHDSARLWAYEAGARHIH